MKRIILSRLLAVIVSPSATALTKEEAAASGDRPMTNAERKRRSRQIKRLLED